MMLLILNKSCARLRPLRRMTAINSLQETGYAGT